MSAWRRKALASFPERRGIILRATGSTSCSPNCSASCAPRTVNNRPNRTSPSASTSSQNGASRPRRTRIFATRSRCPSMSTFRTLDRRVRTWLVDSRQRCGENFNRCCTRCCRKSRTRRSRANFRTTFAICGFELDLSCHLTIAEADKRSADCARLRRAILLGSLAP